MQGLNSKLRCIGAPAVLAVALLLGVTPGQSDAAPVQTEEVHPEVAALTADHAAAGIDLTPAHATQLAQLAADLDGHGWNGCPDMVRLQIDPWKEGVVFKYRPFLALPHVYWAGLDAVARLGYYHCKVPGRQKNQLSPLWIEWCYTRDGLEADRVLGVNMNGKIYAPSGKVKNNPPTVSVDDKGRGPNCVLQHIEEQNWYRVGGEGKAYPKWQANGKVRIDDFLDTRFDFKTKTGSTTNIIDHRNADIPGEWHW